VCAALRGQQGAKWSHDRNRRRGKDGYEGRSVAEVHYRARAQRPAPATTALELALTSGEQPRIGAGVDAIMLCTVLEALRARSTCRPACVCICAFLLQHAQELQ
jgi:hypothetical protein